MDTAVLPGEGAAHAARPCSSHSGSRLIGRPWRGGHEKETFLGATGASPGCLCGLQGLCRVWSWDTTWHLAPGDYSPPPVPRER